MALVRTAWRCTRADEFNYSTRVRLQNVELPDATEEDSLIQVGSMTFDITNPRPPISFVKDRTYYMLISDEPINIITESENDEEEA
jgi:hypothetical protein